MWQYGIRTLRTGRIASTVAQGTFVHSSASAAHLPYQAARCMSLFAGAQRAVQISSIQQCQAVGKVHIAHRTVSLKNRITFPQLVQPTSIFRQYRATLPNKVPKHAPRSTRQSGRGIRVVFAPKEDPSTIKPSSASDRSLPRDDSGFGLHMTLILLAGLNIGIFIMFNDSSAPDEQEQRIWLFQNFTVSWANLLEGRYWVLLTSEFTQTRLWHLLPNMLAMWSFASFLSDSRALRSPAKLLLLYLGGGVCGTVVSFLYRAIREGGIAHDPRSPDHYRAHYGASGSVYAMIALAALRGPRERLYIMFVLPIQMRFGLPALLAVEAACLLMGTDVSQLFGQSGGGGGGGGGEKRVIIDHAAHLGGALFGLLFYLGSRGRRGKVPNRLYK